MATETDPVLARMLAKVAAWQAAVDSYRAAKALEQDTETAVSNGGSNGTRVPIELPVGAFRGMTITAAVKLYLQSVRQKQTVQQIAEGLKAGGIESTAKDFGPSLRSILHNLKKSGELLRFKDGWDLAEAHSTALRNRIARDVKPKAKTKSKKSGKTSKTAKPPKNAGPKGPSLDERVVAFLGTKPMEWFTLQEVAEALRESNPKIMALAFARLVRYGRVAKQGDGRYAAVRK